MATSVNQNCQSSTASAEPVIEEMDTELPQWFRSLRSAFHKDRSEFHRLLLDQFSTDHPYERALFVIQNSPDLACPKPTTMASTVLKEFSKWMRSENREEKYRHLLTFDHQRLAFDIATAKHLVLLKMAMGVFHLVDVAEKFVDDIRNMAANGMFREAAECAATLGVQTYFGLNEIVIPCILQDKMEFMGFYLDSVPELQQELVGFLDGLCSPKANIARFLAEYQHVADIRKEKLASRTLQKLVARLSKSYDVPPERTPNMMFNRAQGTLIYLLRQRYVDQVIHDEDWHDFVEQAIAECPSLLETLVQQLCYKYNDLNEAAKWSHHFGIDFHQLPYKLQRFIRNRPDGLRPRLVIKSNNADGYLSLPLPPNAVLIVNDRTTMIQALKDVETASIIGVDAEWPPFCQAKESVSLLQVATPNFVHLFDIQTLKTSVDESILKNAMRILFCEDSRRKLGFCFTTDLKTLASTLPSCTDEFENVTNLVCLMELVKNLISEDPDFVAGLSQLPPVNIQPKADGPNATSDDQSKALLSAKVNFNLSDLCQCLLGKPLDKMEQRSNWSRRPLRSDQIRYAALDAYCLLSLYEKLRVRAVELKIDFEQSIASSMVGGRADAEKTAGSRSFQQSELLELIKKLNASMDAESARRPAEIRVLADSMMGGLGKHLRRCGVDCLVVGNQEKRHVIIEMAQKEQRMLLSCGNALLTMAATRLPAELICPMPSIPAKEQFAWFLKKMRIRITEQDIMFNCTACNGQDFVSINSRILRVVYDALVAPDDNTSVRPFAFDSFGSYWRHLRRTGSVSQQYLQLPSNCHDDAWSFNVDGCKIDLLAGLISPRVSRNEMEPVRIQIEAIPTAELFGKVHAFDVCRDCGKIYWYDAATGDLWDTVGGLDHPEPTKPN